jgi:hypothetical protein
MYIPTQIGEKCHGGIYVGNYDFGGYEYLLICAEKKYETESSYMTQPQSTMATSLTNGDINTEFLVNMHKSPAAKYCHELTIDGIADWYLPSKEELNLIYLAKNKIFELYGNNESFGTGFYWSSTECHSDSAWVQRFSVGFRTHDYKDFGYSVRATRRVPIEYSTTLIKTFLTKIHK